MFESACAFLSLPVSWSALLLPPPSIYTFDIY
jgi:hypothetical protein